MSQITYFGVRRAHLIVICGIRILITCDDLWCHPIRSAYESVPAAHGAIQLCTYTKVHWGSNEIDGEENNLISFKHMLSATEVQQVGLTVRIIHLSQGSPIFNI